MENERDELGAIGKEGNQVQRESERRIESCLLDRTNNRIYCQALSSSVYFYGREMVPPSDCNLPSRGKNPLWLRAAILDKEVEQVWSTINGHKENKSRFRRSPCYQATLAGASELIYLAFGFQSLVYIAV